MAVALSRDATMDGRRPPIPNVVSQHAQDCLLLCSMRQSLAQAPHVGLRRLQRLDDRLDAHLDGLEIAGESGARLCDSLLENLGVAEVFAATSLALRTGDAHRLERMVGLAEHVVEVRQGVALAFEWASASSLQTVTRAQLESASAFRRMVGIQACDAHGVDPGAPLARAIGDPDALVRAAAMRALGQCARHDLYADCKMALEDGDPECRFWATRSAVLLGDKGQALKGLYAAIADGSHRSFAVALLLKCTTAHQADIALRALLGGPRGEREMARALGVLGDAHHLPWLIERMSEPQLARIAAEAFSTITGADLALLDLERKPPEDAEFGPNDNPEDDDVAMDEDDGLPWPDPERVQGWWDANAHRFQPGMRYFMGAPPSPAHCLQVLKDGYQRQRIAAAEYLCLLQPGTRLFPTSAPAWRQQRWLEQMGA